MTTTKSPRETRQRNAIRQAFEAADRPLGPKEVLDIASEEVPNLGIATIYRNIKAMVEAEELMVVEIPGQPQRYDRPRSSKKQVLFLCEDTNRVFRADNKEGISLNLPKNIDGFDVDSYQLFVYGKLKTEEPAPTA